MSNKSEDPGMMKVLRDLQRSEDIKREAVSSEGLDSQLILLRAWQSNRLANTYADLLEDKLYAPACRFFLTDVYAARDFSQRDHDLEHLYSLLSRILPDSAIQLLLDGITVNQMANTLDHRLLKVLIEKLGMKEDLTAEMYAEGYRICDNYAERAYQIERSVKLLTDSGELTKEPLVSPALRLAYGPALLAGWMDLYGFLSRGYKAFHAMRDLKKFTATIAQREMRILDRIFADCPDPLELKRAC
jgi:hypothetical protein